MNRWEQEFQHLTLEEQKKVLEAIRSTYEQAARDCQNRIAQLNARTDMLNLQSIIYQRRYQEAILNQINGTLGDLNRVSYETIHDYVELCYNNGFIGTMYDLSQQGIPIITPIDQRDVFRASVVDSRLSGGLYSALGEDVNELKDAVRRELSRGIAQGSSWVDVARNLSTHMVNSPFRTAMNNSMTIARTEGHRVQMQGSMDALHVAKDKGADVLKQWDATLDANTRTSHQHVDGEIREVDEKFSNGLMFPSDPKGSAAEVINCRCALLHRARWALDEDELQTLQKRAAYFGLDKTDNFDDFKKKYLGITNDGQNNAAVSNNSNSSMNNVLTTKKAEVVVADEYSVDGVTYKVDGKHVLIQNTTREKEVAKMLSEYFNDRVLIMPRVVFPEGISTPDYIIDGRKYDLKEPRGVGKHLLYNMIHNKKNQAENFIFDITNCPLDYETIVGQVNEIFKSRHTSFVNSMILIRGDDVLNEYLRE